MEKFIVIKDVMKTVRRFGILGRTIEFKIKPIPADEEPLCWVKDAITQIIEMCTEGLEPQDQVGFNFCSKDFARGEGWISFRPASKVSTADVWDIISSIYQSNSSGLNTETFCLGTTTVKMPAGQGSTRQNKYNSFEEECGMRRGIVVINNKDNLCLPRALVVALALAIKDPEYKKVRRDTGKIQTIRTHKLVKDAGVVIPEEGAGIPELQKFQQYLEEYCITVYNYGHKGRDVIFCGAGEGKKKLNLLFHKGHFNVITSLTAAFVCSYFCEACHTPYNTKKDHRCGGTCPACLQTPKCQDNVKIKCTICNRVFKGKECYDKHRKSGSIGKSTVCKEIHKCGECMKVVKSNREHLCGEIFCKICNRHMPNDHMCYMQVNRCPVKNMGNLFIFYDFETTQEKIQEDGSFLHEPNLCVFKQACDNCVDEINLYFCQTCGFKQKVISDDVIERFLNHILEVRKRFKKVVVIAHNGGGFDHQFILNHILTSTDLKPELITRGTKLILMEVENVNFLDSLNYFPMALSKLPKVFGLAELKKGYFPHLFNKLENYKYCGTLPDLIYYDPDNMKDGERNTFLKWYDDHKGDIFDFQKEITEYCISDVDILAQSCLKFRKLILQEGRVCPFTEATTLPSACNKIYRRNFLKPNTIGLIPKNGYRWRDNQSKIGTQWLVLQENQRKIIINHAAKGPEILVRGVKVDGYCADTQQICEFHGCYFHGCTQCYKYSRNAPLQDDPSDTLEQRYESTLAKTERLRNFGYEIIEMWECTFRKYLQENDEYRKYTENHSLVKNTPLNPRDAFYGGRTGNIRTHYKAVDQEKIRYVDVCSLYPYVNKYGKYPIGHPTIYVGEECNALNLKEINGLIKCEVLPPRKLFHPVLPTKMNNKLMFVLCRSCGEEFNAGECHHNDNERVLYGTWVTDELLKAVEKGYELVNIQEIWKYEVEQYNIVTKTGGLFTDYINKFLKIKQQASGWPIECTSPEEKEKYIKEYFIKEGVVLDPEKIEVNPGLRQVGKAVITSFWGKLGQKENQGKTSIVNNPAEFFAMLTNPSIIVNNVLLVNEKTLVVNWVRTEESYDILPTVNVCLAAYTTAQARLKLYSYLENLGERVLYYDTDSVIYVSSPGGYEIPIGGFLGDMTDELECYGPGSYISDFVSGGPKNYAYKVFSTRDCQEHIVCKVKGISLSYATAQIITFDQIKKMILTEQPPIPITSRQIRRTSEHQVVTINTIKLYQPKSTKRAFLSDGSSQPYGYKKSKLNN